MKDNKSLLVTIALFISLLFLSSTASEQTQGRPHVKRAPKAPQKRAVKRERKSTKALQNRLNRFTKSRKRLDADIAKKRNQLRKAKSAKKEMFEKKIQRLQKRHNRITKKIEQIEADIRKA